MRSAWKREGVTTRKWFISLESVVRPVSFVALVPVIAFCVQCCIDRCMQSHLSIYQQFVLFLCISLICFCCRRASIVWNMPKMKRKKPRHWVFSNASEGGWGGLLESYPHSNSGWYVVVSWCFCLGILEEDFFGGVQAALLSTPSISCWTMAKPQS